MAGANDVPYSGIDTVLEDLQQLSEMIRSLNPSATVMVCGILPRNQNLHPGQRMSADFLAKFNKVVNVGNRRLRIVENYVPWMKFLELPGFVSPLGINRKMLARDGLHLSFRGTETAAMIIERNIKMKWDSKRRIQLRLASFQQPGLTEQSTVSQTTSVATHTEPSHTEASFQTSRRDFIGPRLYRDAVTLGLQDSLKTSTPRHTTTHTTLSVEEVTTPSVPVIKKPTPVLRSTLSAFKRPLPPNTNQWTTVNRTKRQKDLSTLSGPKKPSSTHVNKKPVPVPRHTSICTPNLKTPVPAPRRTSNLKKPVPAPRRKSTSDQKKKIVAPRKTATCTPDFKKLGHKEPSHKVSVIELQNRFVLNIDSNTQDFSHYNRVLTQNNEV